MRILFGPTVILLVTACSRTDSRTPAGPPQGYYGQPGPAYGYYQPGYGPGQAGPPPGACPVGMVFYSGQCVVGTPAPQPTPNAAPALPSLVHVTLTGAHIAPTKSGGCQWDGMTCNPGGGQKISNAVRMAMRSPNPYLAVGTILAGPLSSAVEKPDPMGNAELYTGGQFVKRLLQKRQDSFTPNWDVRWERVRLEPATRMSVRLRDADLNFDDDIGSFDIGFDQLVTALQSQQVLQVQVDGVTNGQVLFAGVSVLPAN